jgi:hypothetical protein
MLGKTYHTYNGESITTKTFIKNGQKEYEQVEYQLPYKPTNIPSAIVCGNGLTRRKFFKMIQLVEAGGGLLRENKPEVYACNAAYTERAKPHNLVLATPEIIDLFYQTVPDYPEPFYLPWSEWSKRKDQEPRARLMPGKFSSSAGAMALYLAAWHGHTTIYMVGFDLQPEEGRNNNIYAGHHPLYKDVDEYVSDTGWIRDCLRVFKAYPDVTFVRIVPTGYDTEIKKITIPNFNCPDEWADCDNFKQLDVDTFKLEIDFGPIKDHTRGQLQYQSTGPRVS